MFWGEPESVDEILRVRPETLEFWQGRPHRFHDRILYTARADGSWERHRLQP